MPNKLGFIIADSQEATNAICASGARPAAVVVYNNTKQMHQLNAAFHGQTVIIGRYFPAEEAIHGMEGYPAEQVRDRWLSVMEPVMAEAPFVYWTMLFNEFDNWALAGWYVVVNIEIGEEMAKCGYRGIMGNFCKGQPQVPSRGTPDLEKFFPAMMWAEEHGFLFGLHCYGQDDIKQTDEWLAFRYAKVWDEYRLDHRLPRLKLVITEFGIAPGDPLGWKDRVGAEVFLDQLRGAAQKMALAPYLIGACIFQLGGGWERFQYWEILDNLLADIKADPPPPLKPAIVEVPIPTHDGLRVNSLYGLNVRLGPSTAAYKVGSLPNGTPVRLTGEKSGPWVVIEYPVKTWVHSDYLRS